MAEKGKEENEQEMGGGGKGRVGERIHIYSFNQLYPKGSVLITGCTSKHSVILSYCFNIGNFGETLFRSYHWTPATKFMFL